MRTSHVAVIVALLGACHGSEPIAPAAVDPPTSPASPASPQQRPFTILSPGEGAVYAYEQSITFQSSLPQEEARSLAWTSDRDGTITIGYTGFHWESLSVGKHVITAASAKEHATVTITVNP